MAWYLRVCSLNVRTRSSGCVTAICNSWLCGITLQLRYLILLANLTVPSNLQNMAITCIVWVNIEDNNVSKLTAHQAHTALPARRPTKFWVSQEMSSKAMRTTIVAARDAYGCILSAATGSGRGLCINELHPILQVSLQTALKLRWKAHYDVGGGD